AYALLCHQHGVAQLMTLVRTRNPPTPQRRNIDTDIHERLIRLHPAIASRAGKQRCCGKIESCPWNSQVRLRVGTGVVTLSPPKGHLPECRVLGGVLRQTLPAFASAPSNNAQLGRQADGSAA